MKFLVSGGFGQIGSHIIEKLLEKNYNKVLNIDNLKTGKKYHLKDHKNLKNITCSIEDTNLMKSVFEDFKPDFVVHTAASYNEPNNWILDVKTNCIGGCNLIQESVKHKIKKFIYFQTSLCYGNNPKESPISLNHSINPEVNSYAITKTLAENYLKISGLNFVCFRLANVIGPRNLTGPLPIFYKRLKAKQNCFVTKSRRDFVFVKDLVEVVIESLQSEKAKGFYHFSCGKDISILELYNEVAKGIGFNKIPKPEIKPLENNEVESILLDPSKTFKDFGKIKFTQLDKIVSDSIKYYDEFGVGSTFTHAKD